MKTPQPNASIGNARPISIRKDNEFVNQFHRHSAKVDGGLFAVAAWFDGRLVGIGIAGRPVARMKQDGFTFEIRRVATDGTPNACSFLYARLKRAVAVLGYRRAITYTLAAESGSSPRAAGFQEAARIRPKGWDVGDGGGRRRARRPIYRQEKIRWEAELAA